MSSILNTVYNNYLTSYAPKSLTRFDTHRKSELQSVYNSIVQMSKDSPWYLPTTSKSVQHYAVDLKENARELHNTIAQLGGLEENSIFSKKSAYSSDEEVVTAAYIGSRTDSEVTPEFQLQVFSLARPQENLGLFLSDTAVDIPADTYSFDININDMNYEFQFSIAENENNRDVQNRLIRLINNADIGIKASIVESDSRSAIRLVSEATGLAQEREQIFTITDEHTGKASGTVDYFGLNYTSRAASNAAFLLNGQPRQSVSNHFTIGGQFKVWLNGVSPEDETVQIGLKTDTESFTDNVIHLFGGYNNFIQSASSYIESQSKSQKLVKELSSIALYYSNSLESMGLNLNQDGTVEINRDILKQTAAQTDNIMQTFSYLKDFSNSLLRKTNQISLNPMDYVDKVMVAYKNPGRSFVSPYITSAYSGMMFNGYC